MVVVTKCFFFVYYMVHIWRQKRSHCLNKCWTMCMSSYKILRPQWAKQRVCGVRCSDASANCAREFYQYGSMPEVTSVLNGTHVRIFAPTENEHAFVNRFSNHSLNVQVCYLIGIIQISPTDIATTLCIGNRQQFKKKIQPFNTGCWITTSAKNILGWLIIKIKSWQPLPWKHHD